MVARIEQDIQNNKTSIENKKQLREKIVEDNKNLEEEIDKLKDMVGELAYCDACFTGNYPMKVPTEDISHAFD